MLWEWLEENNTPTVKKVSGREHYAYSTGMQVAGREHYRHLLWWAWLEENITVQYTSCYESGWTRTLHLLLREWLEKTLRQS